MVRGCFFIHGEHGGHGKRFSLKIILKIFVKMSSRRRSKIKLFPEARYSSAFSVEIFVKDYIFSCLSARNLWRKSLIKIWPMARNQSSEFRRSHEKTRILVKDYSKDFVLRYRRYSLTVDSF